MLIAIEGIDGSGKGTQTDALAAMYREAGHETLILRFPQYEETLFGKEVGRYLNGDYGSLEEVPPKFSALLYSMDRRQAVKRMKEALARGIIVICDRYTGSNIAHQCARVPEAERESLASWIREVEEDILEIPKADLVFFLDLDTHQSKSLVAKKPPRNYTNRTHDLHEASDDHLQSALENFRQLAKDPRWIRINCNDSEGKMRPKEEITAELFARSRDARD
jgi:dTMP kinase